MRHEARPITFSADFLQDRIGIPDMGGEPDPLADPLFMDDDGGGASSRMDFPAAASSDRIKHPRPPSGWKILAGPSPFDAGLLMLVFLTLVLV